MRIGTSNSTKILDSACVNEYKIPLIVMMENAVLSAFKHMDIENNQRYVIVSGVGNNGGDGLGLARQLTAHGKEVGIFGTGLEREIKGIFYNVIDIINQNKNKTYSIDIPSGINATNGDVLGICIDADKTISFEFYKRGFLKYDVKQYIGDVIVEHIGIPEYILEKYDDKEYITTLDLVKNNIKEKNKFSFKSDFGKVALFAGSRGFTGAAYISTQSAVKCGSGLTTLVCEKYVQDILSTKFCEAMTLDIQNKEKVKKLISGCDAIGFGCGMGDTEDTYTKLKYVLENSKCPVVIDADGLNCLKNKKDLLEKHPNRIIITPHLGEMARLTGYSISHIRDNKVDVAKEFAQKYKMIVLLKGYETVITDGNYTYINPTGNSSMANGGMGDTLLGIITSFAGQGMTNLISAVCGAYIHGYIGENLSKNLYTVNASDVIAQIPFVMKEFVK